MSTTGCNKSPQNHRKLLLQTTPQMAQAPPTTLQTATYQTHQLQQISKHYKSSQETGLLFQPLTSFPSLQWLCYTLIYLENTLAVSQKTPRFGARRACIS